ncbi:MAG: DUF2723 domain-containing protein [Chloroflexi bacterium]|nr:DUF2723 domain-containing protein [Chloroflexota bacterium]
MWSNRQQLITRYTPGLVAGLFVGRLLSEGTAVYWRLSGAVGWACMVTAVTMLFFTWWLRRYPFAQTWPLLLLSGYLVYPFPSLAAAITAITAVALVWLWARPLAIPFLSTGRGQTAVLLTVGLGFLLLYSRTLSPDLLPADNGEFQLTAATLGVAHPPGFPLYTLLAHLMTRLPWGATPAYRVNLLSVFTSTAALLLVWTAVHHLTRSKWAALTAVLALGTATTFWAQATTANIRSLTALFAVLAFYALLRWQTAVKTQPNPTADRWLILFALALGFGLTHHLSLAFISLICLTFIPIVDPGLLRTPRRWLRPVLAGLLGLLPLLYFPLRANSGAPGAAPNLATLPGLAAHALGLGFSGDFFAYIAPGILWERLRVMGNVLTFQMSPWLLAGAGLGLTLLIWRNRPLAWLLGGSFAFHLFITATYRAPQTVEYMLPAYVPLALCLGLAVGWLVDPQISQIEKSVKSVHNILAILAVGVLLTAVWQTIRHYPSYQILHHTTYVRDAMEPLLQNAPPGSIILADWHWATPLWYLQAVEGQRPDVTVEFVYPRTADYGADWAGRIAAEWGSGRAVIATHYDEIAYANLPTPEPSGNAFLFRHEARLELPPEFMPLDLALGDAVQIAGYVINHTAVTVGQEAILTLAWQATANFQPPISLFAHLVGSDGRLYAQQDVTVTPQPIGLSLTQFRLTPRPGAQPGDYALLIGAYGAEPLLTAVGDARTPIATLPVTAVPRPPFSQNPVRHPLANGSRVLVGYDWDNTLPGQPRLYLHWQTEVGFVSETAVSGDSLPDLYGAWGILRRGWLPPANAAQHYVPLGQGIVWTGGLLPAGPFAAGAPLTLRQAFAASTPVTADLVASVRLIGYEADGFYWAWWDLSDGVPALGAIPTLKWIAGSQVNDPHFVRVDLAAGDGQTIGATVRLYDAFTGRPVPILDERITGELQLPWIPLGQTRVPPD